MLHGRRAWLQLATVWRQIDLSAWISGLSYTLGLALIGPEHLYQAAASNPVELLALGVAYAIFLFIVLRIQKHMRLALSATSFGKPADLYTSGIFRYSRNPIYVAFLLPLASLAILSPPAALLATLLYLLAMTATVIRREEKELAGLFGKTFKDYVSTTPRWLVW